MKDFLKRFAAGAAIGLFCALAELTIEYIQPFF